MNSLLQTTISLILGSVIMIGGVAANTDKIIGEAKSAVNGANLHQIATVLEIYYSDHNQYPNVNGGEELIKTLSEENYIMNQPLDPSVFNYESKANGSDYTLSLAK